MGVVRWLLILVVLFVLIVFGAENMEPITLKFSIFSLFSYEAMMPLFFVVVVSVFSGAALAGLIGLVDHVLGVVRNENIPGDCRQRSNARREGPRVVKV